MKEIAYREVMNLGFQTIKTHDSVYFDQYGFEYEIIMIWLTDNVSIHWDKVTRTATMQRVDNRLDLNILKSMPIQDLEQLKFFVEFFK